MKIYTAGRSYIEREKVFVREGLSRLFSFFYIGPDWSDFLFWINQEEGTDVDIPWKLVGRDEPDEGVSSAQDADSL